MALGGEENVLVAFIGYFDWLSGFERGKCRIANEHGGILFLATESAADRGLADANFFWWKLQRIVQLVHRKIRALQRAFAQDGSIRLRKNHKPLVFDVKLFLVPSPVFGFDDIISSRESLGEVALDNVLILHGIEFGGGFLEDRNGVLQGEQGGELLYFDVEAACGLGREFESFGCDHGNRFAAIEKFAANFG